MASILIASNLSTGMSNFKRVWLATSVGQHAHENSGILLGSPASVRLDTGFAPSRLGRSVRNCRQDFISRRLDIRLLRLNCEAYGSSSMENHNEASLSSETETFKTLEEARYASQDSYEGNGGESIIERLKMKNLEEARYASRDSYEGHGGASIIGASLRKTEDPNVNVGSPKAPGSNLKLIDSSEGRKGNEIENTLWKNVFPSYMQSKTDEMEDTKIGDVSSASGRRGVNGVIAAKAAAAVAASAKEFESQFGSQLPPSAAHPHPSHSSSKDTSNGIRDNLNDLITHDPIWAAIRAEARLEAEREPVLSSFLYASILGHRCFERSLGFVLANRLKNATLLATQLLDVFDDVFMHDANIGEAIRLDVQAVRDRDPSCRSYSAALLYLKGYHALQAYRVAHALWKRGQEVLALALQSRISEVFAVDIHPAARIGKSILLDHGTGVVIGETAVVGDCVSMLQGVTLGGTGKVAGDRHPKIREGVLIGAGATILGNIIVGRCAMVAAGSLVLKDVPPHSMVAGTPATVVGYLVEPTPALTMKHDVTKNICQKLEEAVRQQLYGGGGI